MKLKYVLLILFILLTFFLAIFYDQNLDNEPSVGAGDIWWVDVVDMSDSE
ncbi:hypothetical protein [Natronospora cellulosivora (SeqCode)]